MIERATTSQTNVNMRKLLENIKIKNELSETPAKPKRFQVSYPDMKKPRTGQAARSQRSFDDVASMTTDGVNAT